MLLGNERKIHFFITFLNSPCSLSGLTLSPTVPDLLLTASEDKTVKIWSVKDNQPKLIDTKDMGLVSILFFKD